MQAPSLKNSRIETKFVTVEIELDRLFQWIKMHPSAFQIAYPNRWVNNIYFDTYTYTAYTENLLGNSVRTKTRFRWYGHPSQIDKGTLEIKCKRNCYSWKQHYPVNESFDLQHTSWKKVTSTLTNGLSHEAIIWLKQNPHPIIINRYYRNYFIDHLHKVRITIDTKAKVFDQRYKPMPNIRNSANIPTSIVVEFKFDRNDRQYASTIMQTLPIRVSRHSKYMNAVKSIHGF